MVRTSSPLLSFTAHGSIAGSVTTQRRYQRQFIRHTPVPINPQTLPQMYHRWLYQDYSQQWKDLTPAQQATYRTVASRHHMTPFAVWIRIQLLTFPDIAASYHLDHITGSTTPDSGKNANTATIYGAIPSEGRISSGLSFDGIDDRLQIANSPSIILISDCTIEAFVRRNLAQTDPRGHLADKNYEYHAQVRNDGTLGFVYNDTGGNWRSLVTTDTIDDQWHHIAYVRVIEAPNSHLYIYIDGQLSKDGTQSGTPRTVGAILRIGWAGVATHRYRGLFDNIIIYNRALTASDIKRHSQRSYPL